jgi:hypothetical protein
LFYSSRPIFRVNTNIIPTRKSLPIQIPELPRLSSSNSSAIPPSHDLSKLSLSLNNFNKTESSSIIKKTQTTISSFLINKSEPKTTSPVIIKPSPSLPKKSETSPVINKPSPSLPKKSETSPVINKPLSFLPKKTETSPVINKPLSFLPKKSESSPVVNKPTPSLPKKFETNSSSICPLCKEPYDLLSRRPISEDSCGHTMCLNCLIRKNNQNGCIQCEIKVEKEEEEEVVEVEVEEPFSTNDNFNDFDQDQLFDDWNESKQTDIDLINSIYDDETEENDSEDENQIDNEQQPPYKVQWLSHIKDDAAEFSSDHTYPHTKEMLRVFGIIFGLKQVKKKDNQQKTEISFIYLVSSKSIRSNKCCIIK